MNLLPRFNFFSSMLPLSPPPGYFKEINSIISKFIWNDKCPRIKLTTFQHTSSWGGLAVPNFELYYWSFQLKALQCSCGSVVEHCVSSAKGCGFNSQGTHILIKTCIAWMHCKSLWIKASAKCINVNVNNWVDPQSTVSWRVIEADKVKPNRLQDILFTGTGKKGDNYKFE